MLLRTLRFAALLLAALAMGMHLAHALELPPKLRWSPELYLAVQTSLYGLFGSIGPVLEVGALLLVSITAWRLRGRPAAFRLTLASASAIVLALLVWGVVVRGANLHIAQWQASGVAPTDWMHWRAQWQYGQAFIFVLHLVGFSCLVGSVLRDTEAGAAS